jgi:ABC-type uncharacterized transport system involved in gliding motility auxiliary subunit
MAELLFIATTIFVAYVVFEVVGKKNEPSKTTQATENPKPSVATKVDTTEKAPPAAVIAKPLAAKPAKKPTSSKAKSAPAKASAPVINNSTNDTLKNPKTGETAKIPNNYAFAKRWIKDALVEEGLLDKVYKNNELDSATTAKIQTALDQLKAIEKYQ